MYRGEKYEIVYGGIRVYQDDKLSQLQFFSHEFMLQRMICHPACFITKATYDDLGTYSLEYRSSSDYDWMLKRYTEGKAVFTPTCEMIANIRVGGISGSNLGYRETLKLSYQYKQISFPYYAFYLVKSRVGDLIRAVKG